MQRKQKSFAKMPNKDQFYELPDFDFGNTDEKDDCFQEWVTHNFSITQKRPAINLLFMSGNSCHLH